ncbi:MAG: DUF3365 domain-containing protein [Gammaproteobacteria bacterium]|nr:DUF3365 domain-containing protein [Gammaproteobacteria bacterium]
MKTKFSVFKALVLATALSLAAVAAAQSDIAKREEGAKRIANAFLKELGGALKREMAKAGPSGAIGVCTDLAPEIANRLSRENGWRVTRVGTRVRNPMIGMPDAWEQQVLAKFGERQRKGESLKDMSYAEIVSEPGAKYFRYMKAIGVRDLCLTCHGAKEQLPDLVQAAFKEHYPFDQATGYKRGDLRGAISIKQPLDLGPSDN